MSALSLIPLVVIGLHGYRIARQAVLDQVRERITSTVRARYAMIDSWLAERHQDINTLAHLPNLVQKIEGSGNYDVDVRFLEGLLETTRATGQPYESLTVYDRHWSIVAHERDGSHTEDEILSENFRSHVESSKDVYLDIAHLHESNQVGSHFGIAIRTEANEAVGYLVANLNLSESLSPLLMDRSGLGRSGKAYLIANDLEVLTEPFESGQPLAFKCRANPVLLECQTGGGEDVREYVDFFGHTVHGTSMTLPVLEWGVVVEIDRKEVMAWEKSLLIRTLVTLSVLVVAIVLASLWLSNLLGRPLSHLAAVVLRITSGNSDERLGAMGIREANEVGLAFNRMLDELKKKERQIVTTATLAAVGELTSRIAHEIRNPISSIKLNLQTISQSPSQDANCKELAQIAIGQAKRVEDLVGEMLEYAKPLAMTVEDVAFEDLMATSVQDVKRLADEKGVRLVFKDNLVHRKLLVDAEHFSQALANLLKNAFEASPVGSQVEVQAYELKNELWKYAIEVRDHGLGIRSDVRPRLFTPFFTTKPGGTGLGLANVRRIVDLHGGSVVAENGREGGAVFTIKLQRIGDAP